MTLGPIPELVTLDDAAAALHCARRTLLNAATRGEIKTVLVFGRRLIPLDELRRLAREGSAGAKPVADAPPAADAPPRRGRPRKIAPAATVAAKAGVAA